jgi:hypothetical protein
VFNVRRDASGRRGFLVLDREELRIFFILLEEHEKSPSLDSQDLLDILPFDFVL